jgi:hypothetical protein
MIFNDFGLQSPAAADDGVITANLGVVGYPTATCTAGSITAPSAKDVWPSWIQSATRDNVDYRKMTDFTMTIDPGGDTYNAAAGEQGPQGHLVQGQEVTGSFTVFLTDEDEYDRWQGASSSDFVLTFDTPNKLTSNMNRQMIASLTQFYIENATKGEENEALTLSADYRMVEDATNGLAKFLIRNGVPGIAYGNDSS